MTPQEKQPVPPAYFVYNDEGDDLGPFSLDELRAKTSSGEFSSEKVIRERGSTDWLLLSQVLNLKFHSPATSPNGEKEGRVSLVETCPKCSSAEVKIVTIPPSGGITGCANFAGIVVCALIWGGSTGRTTGIVFALIMAIIGLPIINVLVNAMFESRSHKCSECSHEWPLREQTS